MDESKYVVRGADAPVIDLGGGTSRRILAHNDALMIVEVSFETGGIGSVHTHPHYQSTYVLSGRFRFTIAGESVEVAQGDTIAFPSGIEHGTVCLEKGVLIDIFNPQRDDFLTK